MKNKIFYGWIVVGVTALVLLVAMGVRSSPGVFLPDVEKDTGWGRADISLAVAIGLIMLGLSGPLSGWLMGRYGIKKIMIAGLIFTAISMLSNRYIHQLWQLNLLWGFVSGLGSGLIGSVLGPAVANRWFHEKRGLITGVFGAATSAGQLIFVPLLMSLVLSVGWRTSSMVIGVLAVLALIPVIFLMRDDPAQMGLRPYGAPESFKPAPSSITADAGIMQRALQSPEFWLLAITFFVCGATSNGLIGTHLIAHAADHGIPQAVASWSMALMGGMNFIGTLASGWLTDKYDPRKLLCAYYGFRGLSLLFLPYVTEAWGLAAFAVLFGLDYIATVPPTTALVADNFGRKNVGLVYGWVFCSHQVGAAMAAWLGGVARQSMGDYALAFLIAGVIAVIAGMLSLRIGRQSVPAVAV